MTREEEAIIAEELTYWLDNEIELRLDSEFARVTRVYESIQDEETQWQQTKLG